MGDTELDDILAAAQSDADAEGAEDEEFIFDFSEAGSGVDFKVGAPHGKRLCVVKSVKADIAKKSGKPKLVFVLQVVDGPYKGKQFWLHSPTSGSMSIKGKQVLEACGLEFDADEPVAPFRRSDVVGQQVVVESKPQQGKPQYDDILAIFGADEELFETEAP